MVAGAQAIVDAIYDDVLGSLPARERAAFVAALERLVTGRLSEPADLREAGEAARRAGSHGCYVADHQSVDNLIAFAPGTPIPGGEA